MSTDQMHSDSKKAWETTQPSNFADMSEEERLEVLNCFRQMNGFLTSVDVRAKISLGRIYDFVSAKLNRESRRTLIDSYLVAYGRSYDDVARILQQAAAIYRFWKDYRLTTEIPVDAYDSIRKYVEGALSKKSKRERKRFIKTLNRTRTFNDIPLSQTKQLRRKIEQIKSELSDDGAYQVKLAMISWRKINGLILRVENPISNAFKDAEEATTKVPKPLPDELIAELRKVLSSVRWMISRLTEIEQMAAKLLPRDDKKAGGDSDDL